MTHRTQGAGGGSTPAAGAKGPDELREQIEQTRSQLGHTVEELAAKADVKGRARARAADLRDKAGAMTVQLRSTAAQAGHKVQATAARAGHSVQERASRAGHTAQERAARTGHTVQTRAGQAGHTVERTLPGPVRTAVRVCLRNPRALMIAGAAGAVLLTAGVLARRRH
ncbi:DUF3618 domain-containing protein [Streptomyces sp. NPDC046831]|uniref:DUF3618 domain-containing protein n=1 Tax=Streptomyces sp. NPDC046831 TaxID=3154805 RepID=UPI0033C1711C